MKNLHCIKGHHFINLLDQDSIVVDLGANRGDFARFLYAIQPCKIHCIEASKELFEQLVNTPGGVKHHLAINDKNGSTKFILRENIESNSLMKVGRSDNEDTRIVEVESSRLSDFISRNGMRRISLIKMDIEGAERDVFDEWTSDLEEAVDQMTVEYHDFLQTSYITTRDVKNILKKLRRTYYVVTFSPRSYKDVLLIKKSLISYSDYLRLHFARVVYIVRLAIMKLGFTVEAEG
jgi:FkbM family methyltransferase